MANRRAQLARAIEGSTHDHDDHTTTQKILRKARLYLETRRASTNIGDLLMQAHFTDGE